MSEYPPKKTETKSSVEKSVSELIGEKLPVVHSLHTNLLLGNGWVRAGNVYMKGDKKIMYDGLRWMYKNERIEFLEDIKD